MPNVCPLLRKGVVEIVQAIDCLDPLWSVSDLVQYSGHFGKLDKLRTDLLTFEPAFGQVFFLQKR